MRHTLSKSNRDAVIALLGRGLPVTEIARQCGVHRATLYRWRASDATLRAAWNDIQERRFRQALRDGAAIQAAFEAQHAARNAALRPLRQAQAAAMRDAKVRKR